MPQPTSQPAGASPTISPERPQARIPSASGAKPQDGTTSISPASSPHEILHPIPLLNQEHTPAKGENPVFGGHEVGIGFSGTCNEEGAELEATALAGKRSFRLMATLKLMRPA